MSDMNRRAFLKTSAATAGAFSALTFLPKSVRGANERVRVAICGLHGRGSAHMDGLLHEKNVEIAYLVDPDADVLANAVERVKARNLPEPKGVADVRKALEDPDLTAVTIATPHQWHALITVWGCQAGKHVYVEKPCSHTIHGGRVAVTASRKYNTIVQHGTQQRSDQTRANQMKAILEGKFGKLLVSHGHASKGRGSIGVKPVEPVPANVNWDLWRGPAMIPDDGFHRNFVHYNWHWFWITGNGEIGNQGVHQMDVARWALGKAYPKRVMSIGGRFAWNDQGETPNSQFAVMDFGDDQYLFFTVRNVTHKGYQTEVKNDFYFEDYRLVNNKLYRNGSDQEEKVDYPKAEITPGGPFGSFVNAIRAGKREACNADIEIAHYSSALGHLANISHRLGEKVPFSKEQKAFGDNKAAHEAFERMHDILKDGVQLPIDKTEYLLGPWLEFDGEREVFVGDRADEANKLLRDDCRKGYEMPEADKV